MTAGLIWDKMESMESATNLGQLIQQIFSWSLLVLGVAVFVSFFYAGFLYLTAAGNTTRTGEAKSRMTNAIFGAILLLSSYLILYTINPDFVKNTFNLPGLGTTSPGDSNPPPGGPVQDCTTSPNWQACNETSQLGLVDRVKAYVISQGIADLTTPCGSFEIVKRVAWTLQATGAGTLVTFHSSRCPATGMSGDLIAYPDGSLVDILSGGTTQWIPNPGPITESGVSYAAPTDPGDPTGSY